jgi:DNA-binding ferritin-like protein
MATEISRLDSYTSDLVKDLDTVNFLAHQMANLASSTRKAAQQAEKLNDLRTNELLIEVVRDLDKWLWLLETHIQNQFIKS